MPLILLILVCLICLFSSLYIQKHEQGIEDKPTAAVVSILSIILYIMIAVNFVISLVS